MLNVNDSFKKIIIVKDVMNVKRNEDGIILVDSPYVLGYNEYKLIKSYGFDPCENKD